MIIITIATIIAWELVMAPLLGAYVWNAKK